MKKNLASEINDNEYIFSCKNLNTGEHLRVKIIADSKKEAEQIFHNDYKDYFVYGITSYTGNIYNELIKQGSKLKTKKFKSNE